METNTTQTVEIKLTLSDLTDILEISGLIPKNAKVNYSQTFKSTPIDCYGNSVKTFNGLKVTAKIKVENTGHTEDQ